MAVPFFAPSSRHSFGQLVTLTGRRVAQPTGSKPKEGGYPVSALVDKPKQYLPEQIWGHSRRTQALRRDLQGAVKKTDYLAKPQSPQRELFFGFLAFLCGSAAWRETILPG
jgi:hypothetical protein